MSPAEFSQYFLTAMNGLVMAFAMTIATGALLAITSRYLVVFTANRSAESEAVGCA